MNITKETNNLTQKISELIEPNTAIQTNNEYDLNELNDYNIYGSNELTVYNDDALPQNIQKIFSSQESDVSGIINRYLWRIRNRVSNKLLRNAIDYYVVGGMTSAEQTKYLSHVNKDPLRMSKINAGLDFAATSILAMAPVASDLAAKSLSSYDGELGTYAAIGLIAPSVAINGSRLAYNYITKKPIESFSIFSLFANSTTYMNNFAKFMNNKKSDLEFILRANHEDMFYPSDSIKKSIYSENKD